MHSEGQVQLTNPRPGSCDELGPGGAFLEPLAEARSIT